MTHLQRAAFTELVSPFGLYASEFHHGCAPGSDFQAAIIAREWGLVVIGHPGKSKRGGVLSNLTAANHLTLPPQEYLKRNHTIVDRGNMLVAAPRNGMEEQRSGTWATIRYARKLKRPIYIVWLDGNITQENT